MKYTQAKKKGFSKLHHFCLLRRGVTCSSTKAVEDITTNEALALNQPAVLLGQLYVLN